MTDPSHRFAYTPPVVRFGRGAIADLPAELDELRRDRALVVCGRSVGSNAGTIDPVSDALGDRLVGIVDETTPDKRLAAAFRVLDRARHRDVDVLIGLGGGSSLDVARVASALSTTDRSEDEVYEHFVDHGTVPLGPEPALPVAVIPTTLAGAGLSHGAGISVHPDTDPVPEGRNGGVRDVRLMPAVAIYDPSLVGTAPGGALRGSAMNGFDKGLETLYAPNAGPITDATASRGLRLLSTWLPRLGEPTALGRVLEGIVSVQYGTSRADGTSLSLIHAFGHGLTATIEVQQGVAHAILAPATLRYLFEHGQARRRLIADALGVSTPDADGDELAAAVIGAVERLRDDLHLPDRLRSIEGLSRDDLPAVAEFTSADPLAGNVPPGVDTTREALLDVLEGAW